MAEVGMERTPRRKCEECGGEIPRYQGTGKARRETRKDARLPFCDRSKLRSACKLGLPDKAQNRYPGQEAMIIRNNLDYDRACKVAGTHPVKTAPNPYLRVGAAKKKNAPDEPDCIICRRWLFRYTMNSKRRDMRIHVRASRSARRGPRCKGASCARAPIHLRKRNAEKAAAWQ
jgi:hypothetical protein